MYKDIYSDDFWYLEIFSETASKYNAIQFLRQNTDLKSSCVLEITQTTSMFDGCDEGYAVANAKPELKERATAVITVILKMVWLVFLIKMYYELRGNVSYSHLIVT